MKLFLRWLVMAFAVWAATALIPGIHVSGGFGSYLWVAILISLVNMTIGSLLKLLTLPAVILSLGIFVLVINAAMLELVSRWSSHFDVKNFGSAILGSIVISIVSGIVNLTLGKGRIASSRKSLN